MTLKEYFQAGNQVYHFTEEQKEELLAMLEEWKASYYEDQEKLLQK